ncbi:FAST kinase domain-containing protein 4-like [Hyperolius riggenbachi]|uniref:FAST kinase domain-containing protein 4-like n=1 Tax=Hyperolius riggenbachi TaxID=752182 RepID=UPI0035A3C8A4
MAARLILRGCRLLAASASFQPLPPTTLSECVRSCQVAPSSLPKASLHTSSLCSLADSLPEPIGDTHKDLLCLLKSAESVDDILAIATSRHMDGNKSSMVICEIANREVQYKQEVLKDQRFQDLLKAADTQIHGMYNINLIKLLKSLHRLGMDRKDQILQSLETEVLWRLRKLNMGNLAQLSSYLTPADNSIAKGSLQQELMKQVELRWTEIKEPRTVVALLFRLGHMSKTLTEHLEDKVLEFADQFTPEQTRKIILAFAAQGRRSLPVLRVLSFHLWQHQPQLSPSVILSLLSSYAKLTFCHTQMVDRMTKDIIPRLPELTSLEISSLTRSLSLLKFSNVPLCEAITQACLERSESFSTSQLCYIILNFANLNFHPKEEFFSLIHQRVIPEMDSLRFNLQLDLVLSLCILSHVTTPFLQRVLEPQFYSKILEETSQKSRSHCWKLLQINCTAQLECPDYPGPLLPRDVLQSLARKAKSLDLSELRKSVQDVLKVIYPAPEPCRFNTPNVYGWQLDCELVLDSEYNALPVKDFEAPYCLQSEGTQPLPQGARRLVVVCRDFSFFHVRSKDLLGAFVMNRRHLQAAGFLVVEVPYYEWQELHSEWLKQSYLKDQIKKAVAEDMAR